MYFQANSTVSFSKKHEDTPLPSPAHDAIDEPINSNETSTETVIPQFGIDAKYIIPTPNLNQSNEYHDERPEIPTVSYFDIWWGKAWSTELNDFIANFTLWQ